MTKFDSEIASLDAHQWHAVLGGFSDARIEQTHAYAAVRSGRGNLRHLVVHGPDGPVAAAQCVERRVPVFGKSILFLKYGPLWQPRGRDPNAANLRAALAALHARLVDRERGMLRVMPAADPSHPDLTRARLAILGYQHQSLANPERYLVDLSCDTGVQRASLKGKWRYNLKRAEANGLDVGSDDSPDALRRFGDLHQAMGQRKSFDEPFAMADLPRLGELPSALRPRVLVCTCDGISVAAAVIDTAGDTAQYMWGAMNTRGAELDAGYVLHWRALEWLRQRDYRWYDLGGDCGNAGLRQFKSGLIGKRGRVVALPGYFDSAGSLLAGLAGRVAFGIRNR